MALLHTTELAVELAEIAADARDYVAASRAENTTRVYRTGWAQFTAWCDEHGVTALPAGADTVARSPGSAPMTPVPVEVGGSRPSALSGAGRSTGRDVPGDLRCWHAYLPGGTSLAAAARRSPVCVAVRPLGRSFPPPATRPRGRSWGAWPALRRQLSTLPPGAHSSPTQPEGCGLCGQNHLSATLWPGLS